MSEFWLYPSIVILLAAGPVLSKVLQGAAAGLMSGVALYFVLFSEPIDANDNLVMFYSKSC